MGHRKLIQCEVSLHEREKETLLLSLFNIAFPAYNHYIYSSLDTFQKCLVSYCTVDAFVLHEKTGSNSRVKADV